MGWGKMMLKEIVEASKMVKVDIPLDKVYRIVKVGYDTNGNWSYMVQKGTNKPKKIQHQGEWGEKITKDSKDVELSPTAIDIIDYYREFKS